jgi:hypothetical protein
MFEAQRKIRNASFVIPFSRARRTSLRLKLREFRHPQKRRDRGYQNAEGSLLQLTGSEPISRSAKLFMVSFLNTPGTGGTQSPGIETTRTSTSALRLSRDIYSAAERHEPNQSFYSGRQTETSGDLLCRIDVDRQGFRMPDDDLIALLDFVEALDALVNLHSSRFLLRPA